MRDISYYANLEFKRYRTAKRSAQDSLPRRVTGVTPKTTHNVARKVQIEYHLANNKFTTEEVEAHCQLLDKSFEFSNAVSRINIFKN